MKKTTEKYSPEDAYNADETRLLYRLMPKKKCYLKEINAKEEKKIQRETDSIALLKQHRCRQTEAFSDKKI